MRKLFSILIAVVLAITLTSCGEDHTGQVKTPSDSSSMEGRNYSDVVKIFEEKGFSNIKTEEVDDLILGWLSEEGDVKEVVVGGDVEYAANKWVPADIEVIIRYHVFPEDTEPEETEPENTEPENTEPEVTEAPSTETTAVETEPELSVLTIDNCPELENILCSKTADYDDYSDFAEKYSGKTIEFDGRIDYCELRENKKTRFDFLLSFGDYDPEHQIGPTFKFEDVNYGDLHTDLEEVGIGLNVHIVAEVGEFNSNTGIFLLDPISVTGR